MPFRTRERNEWIEIANGQCQADFWVGEVLKHCALPAEHVHHIIPESECKARGLDPNATVGLPLCAAHHVGKSYEVSDVQWEPHSVMHPDMNEALREYRAGDKEAFKKAASGHHRVVETGIDEYVPRFTAGDWESDEYYTLKMLELKLKFNLGGK